MLLVKDLGASTLPKEFVDLLPTHCSCGAETAITPTLSTLYCPNPFCLDKGIQRMVTMLRDDTAGVDGSGVKNMGEARCREFLQHFGVTSPYSIFMYEPDQDGVLYPGCSMEFSESIFEQLKPCRDMLLWEFVRMGNLPGIRDVAHSLFSGFDSLEDFYEQLDEEGSAWIMELLGIKGKQDNSGADIVSVRALAVYETLVTFKEELMDAVTYFNIRTLDTPTINVCASTSVGGGYKNKQAFINAMNATYESKVHLNFFKTLKSDVDVLIWSKEGSPTKKVEKVETMNMKKYLQNVATQIELARLAGDERSDEEIEEALPPETKEDGFILVLTATEFEGMLENF